MARFRIIRSWLAGNDVADKLGKLQNTPASERSYWQLDDADRAIFTYHTDKERSKRGYPTSGRSETIMRNRLERAKSFGLPHSDNTYLSYKGKGR